MMKKAILVMFCLLMLLLLSACHIHIDTDPWPASPDYASPEVTSAPADAAVTQTPDPSLQNEADATDSSQTSDDENQPDDTPSPPPADGPVEPGING